MTFKLKVLLFLDGKRLYFAKCECFFLTIPGQPFLVNVFVYNVVK